MRMLCLVALLLMPFRAVWADDLPQGWANESELALVTVSGNADTQSTSGKEKTTYTFEKNTLTNSGRYLETKAAGVETALSWDFGLRYDYNFSSLWSAYVGYLFEADPFSGYVQRNSADLGFRYVVRKTEKEDWSAEAGLRNSDTYTTLGEHQYANYGRLYTEYARVLSETLSAKIWLEYLPDFNSPQGYLANGEASLTEMLSKTFSLKLSYLDKYQNQPPVEGNKRLDSTFTTSLVAKF